MFLRGLSLLILSLSSMCVLAQTLPSCDHISSGRCLYKGNVYVGTSDKVKTKDFYEGEVLNRLFHGKGTYWFYEDGPNKGDKYVGEYFAGLITGKGTYYFNNGEKYVGGFKNGAREGFGTNYFVDGTVFEGSFVAGQKQKGAETYSNGDKYDGSFANNKANGYGVYYMLANNEFKGDRYEGKFLNGEYSGVGTYFYSNGSKNVCENLNNKCNGVGVFVSESKIKYVGEYLNGLRHGQGVLYNPSGGVISQGLWAEGNFVTAKVVSSVLLQRANQVAASVSGGQAEVTKKQSLKNADSLILKCKNLGLTEGAKDFELCLKSLKK